MPSFRGNYRDVFRPDSAATPVVPSARDSTTERGHYIDLARRHLLPCLKQENSAKWGIDNKRPDQGLAPSQTRLFCGQELSEVVRFQAFSMGEWLSSLHFLHVSQSQSSIVFADLIRNTTITVDPTKKSAVIASISVNF